MEGRELQADRTWSHRFPKLPVWIIEYVWARKMLDVQEVVGPSDWPEVDSQPLSIEDSWRLRVASAHAYSIVKNRDVERYERVMGFLEDTYRLLPALVAPIKHMKIMFGLKTMVIMWMLREGRGMVETVLKITQFFPSKLPQYQDRCNQHEMLLMRKNNMDFKALAQALAMDKDKLEDYIKEEMGKRYGEHYAQKVEDRLLHYLQELEAMLPGDTFIDKILKKQCPVTEEEKLLLQVITSDSTTIATTLRKLLHCAKVSQSSERGETEMESSQLSASVPCGSSSNAPAEFQPEVFNGGVEAFQEVTKHCPLLQGNDSHSDVRGHQQTQDGEVTEEASGDKQKPETSRRSRECVQEAASSPQFCSKHQRWVRSILQECPDECSEELLLWADVSSSPLLFQASSSTSSSQDLTPSGLIPCPPDQQQHPPSPTVTHPQTEAEVLEQASSKDKQSSGSASNISQTESLPQPSSRDTLLPTLLSPVVRLIDIASIVKSCATFKPQQASLNPFIMCSNKQTASTSSPHCHTSRKEDSAFRQLDSVASINPPNTTHKLQLAPVSHDASTFASCQTSTPQSFSRPARNLRRAFTTSEHSETLDRFSHNPLAASQSGTLSSVCIANQIPSPSKSPQQVVPQDLSKNPAQARNTSPFRSKNLLRSSVISSTPNSDCPAVRSKTCRLHRAPLNLSLPSQAVLKQCMMLQPYVSLTRLSAEECCRATEGEHAEPVSRQERKDEESSDSSFDVNTLYSSHSSSSDSRDSLDRDPEYKPCIRKKRLLLEYETEII